MSTEQVTKIRKDLELVRANMDVFAEILNDIKPGTEKPADIELLEELNLTCKEMQNRIGDLLTTVSGDNVTEHLLTVNDDLNQLFLRYERYKNNRRKLSLTISAKPPPEPTLIDFSDESLVTDIQSLNLKDDKKSSFNIGPPSHIQTEDDMALVMNHRQSDFAEMEAWLEANPGPVGRSGAAS